MENFCKMKERETLLGTFESEFGPQKAREQRSREKGGPSEDT